MSLPPAELEPSSPEPEIPRSGIAVKRTTYLWTVLLVISVLLPRLLSGLSPEKKPAPGSSEGSPLTVASFERFVIAETSARGAFAMEAAFSVLAEKERTNLLRKAATAFRKLAGEAKSARSARRVLIIEHALHKPLDTAFVTSVLRNSLAAAKLSPAEQQAELDLWRRVYGLDAKIPASEIPAAVAQVRAMKLGFFQDHVFAAVYRAGGNVPAQKAAEKSFTDRAVRQAGAQFALSGYIVVAFLTGLTVLIYAVAVTRFRNFDKIAVPTRYPLPRRLGYGDLLDVFVFYLMIIMAVRAAAGLLLRPLLPNPTIEQTLILQTVVYVGTGFLSVAYLVATARGRNTRLSDTGWNVGQGLGKEIGFGVLGFFATLPFTFALGQLSRLIFRHQQNLTPNPVLPLIVGENELWGRVVIFLLAAVAAPLFEELFFRGALFSGLRTRFGRMPSILLSAVLFAIVHPINDWLPIIGLGIVFAVLRESRQSLVPSITAHFLQNAQSFVFLMLLVGS